ncbi:NIPSNAP family protein [Pedobacter sandarakinus]|uniref:NIPSNAP family protein n=1 Tax=Pedobacter sandarakinus TaxID=353156 RepID=UPI0022451705|nr:NIPSNAP family protein [Pedobacter sandarakinus]MCX2573888.1 NIPSNAP family protein [Pedobacter sandarakinus]
MKHYFTKLFVLAGILLLASNASNAAKDAYYYQLKVYHLKSAAQETMVDTYLKDAFIPAAHRAGISAVGVFKPVTPDTAEKIVYVFVPFKKMDDILKLAETMAKDDNYLKAGASYLNAEYNMAPYERIETIILKAFTAMPSFAVPQLTTPKSERVYELRSYEAATENLSLNKIGMFNDHEVAIFTKLNFNAVFYGQVIAGSKMPNLMYMTTFNNKADRDKHWAGFGDEYKKISGLPQYQHNVSKNVTLFVRPTDYSDI